MCVGWLSRALLKKLEARQVVVGRRDYGSPYANIGSWLIYHISLVNALRSLNFPVFQHRTLS